MAPVPEMFREPDESDPPQCVEHPSAPLQEDEENKTVAYENGLIRPQTRREQQSACVVWGGGVCSRLCLCSPRFENLHRKIR